MRTSAGLIFDKVCGDFSCGLDWLDAALPPALSMKMSGVKLMLPDAVSYNRVVPTSLNQTQLTKYFTYRRGGRNGLTKFLICVLARFHPRSIQDTDVSVNSRLRLPYQVSSGLPCRFFERFRVPRVRELLRTGFPARDPDLSPLCLPFHHSGVHG